MPANGTLERYRALEWLNFIATELHKGFGPLLRKDMSAEMGAEVRTVLARKFDTIDRHLSGQSGTISPWTTSLWTTSPRATSAWTASARRIRGTTGGKVRIA